MNALPISSLPVGLPVDMQRRFNRSWVSTPTRPSSPTDTAVSRGNRTAKLPAKSSAPSDFELCVALIEIQRTHSRLMNELDALLDREDQGRGLRSRSGPASWLAEAYAARQSKKIEKVQREIQEARARVLELVRLAEDRLQEKKRQAPTARTPRRFERADTTFMPSSPSQTSYRVSFQPHRELSSRSNSLASARDSAPLKRPLADYTAN